MATKPKRTPHDLEAWSQRLSAVTAEAADRTGIAYVERAIGGLLRVVREHLGFEVVFVGEFLDGQRVVRHISARDEAAFIKAGQSHPLEETVCQRIVVCRNFFAASRA